ncbi:MAG: methyltransferase domain-containing protein [Bacteroidales bacterium]|nr:methyltransferase domain-containing protein [Bacteroidales bacterium]
MISKSEIAGRFGRSAATYDSASVAQQRAARLLADGLCRLCSPGASVFEVGCGTGSLTRMLINGMMPHLYIANDISDGMLARLASSTADNLLSTLHGDAERLSWPSPVDVVVSASSVQWFDNPLCFVDKSYECLSDNGLMGVATYGPQTFCELQALGVPGLHYPTIDEWTSRIKAVGLTLLSADNHSVVLHYPSALEVMRDLQRAGVTSSEHQLKPGSMRTLMSRYERMFSDDMGVSLTYDIYIFIARKS